MKLWSQIEETMMAFFYKYYFEKYKYAYCESVLVYY